METTPDHPNRPGRMAVVRPAATVGVIHGAHLLRQSRSMSRGLGAIEPGSRCARWRRQNRPVDTRSRRRRPVGMAGPFSQHPTPTCDTTPAPSAPAVTGPTARFASPGGTGTFAHFGVQSPALRAKHLG